MEDWPEFNIQPAGTISNAFLAQNIHTFRGAASYIQELPYHRNTDKEDLLAVFDDQCGTCSTKHAVLKKLADENGYQGLHLMLGLFKMNADNARPIAATLNEHGLDYIPEAHNYFRFHNRILDFTRPGSEAANFQDDLIMETEIRYDQVIDFKMDYHRTYMQEWLGHNRLLGLSVDDLWLIREKCIRALSI